MFLVEFGQTDILINHVCITFPDKQTALDFAKNLRIGIAHGLRDKGTAKFFHVLQVRVWQLV